MLKLTLMFALVLTLGAPSFAAKPAPVWQKGVVVSQDLNSSQAGTYAAPMGNATIAIPVYRTSNSAVIETDKYRFQWLESGNRPLVLPVNSEIEFYQEGDWFIVLDSKHHKHKFSLVGMISKSRGK